MYSNPSNQPASNYIPRAAAALQQICENILQPGAVVLNLPWKEPTQEIFMRYARDLPAVLNWFAQEGEKHGIPMRTFENKPLSEEDLSELEILLAGMSSVVIENDAANEKTAIITNTKDKNTVVLKNNQDGIVCFATIW
jgi:hypothetical protein